MAQPTADRTERRAALVRRIVYVAVALLAVAAAAVFTAFARFDAEAVGRDALAALERATGRMWTLREAPMFEPRARPTVVLRGLHLANAEWGTRPDLVSIARVDIEGAWRSVLADQPRITALRFDGVELNLETNGDGNGNWARNSAAAAPVAVAAAGDRRRTWFPGRNVWRRSVLFLDGVYVDGDGSAARFRWVKAPTNVELTRLTHTIAHRVARYLERHQKQAL